MYVCMYLCIHACMPYRQNCTSGLLFPPLPCVCTAQSAPELEHHILGSHRHAAMYMNMYVCVCVCVCVYIYIYICMYVCMYVCIYVYMYICILESCMHDVMYMHVCKSAESLRTGASYSWKP